MYLCSYFRLPQHRIDNVVFFSVRVVEVGTPFRRKTNAVQKVCELPEMGVEVMHTIAYKGDLVVYCCGPN
jgi:hypothetical protein